MAADKRSTHTDALETLGTVLRSDEARDAIHLAVEPVVAGQRLKRGEHVGFDATGKVVKAGTKVKALGIVDPFLTCDVEQGERFWLVVYPREITSLRHVWAHPDFPVVPEVAKEAAILTEVQRSINWIENYADSFPMSYDTLMIAADEWVSSQRKGGWGEYLCLGGLLEGECVSDEFWPHYEIVRGETVEEDHRGSFFTCSC